MLNENFKKFGKTSNTVLKDRFPNAVIYTRVSTEKQRSNFSLETQLEKCYQCSITNKLKIVEQFGGTSESAKTDVRPEFQKMLKFVKNPKNKIGYIIVSHFDRLSRTGLEGYLRSEELEKKFNVQAIDANTTSLEKSSEGKIVKGINFILANSENDNRRKKCVDGSIKRLESGYWCGQPTLGYIKIDKFALKLTKEAEHIKTAFEMKSNGYANTDILKKIRALGSSITKSRLPIYLSNPFYCGMINNNHLNGRVIQGKHEPLISKELFLKVNNFEIVSKDYKTSKMEENRPLQGDLKCSCGGVFTGYVKKAKHHYYKCNKCKHNSSVKPLNDLFEQLLRQYNFDSKYLELFKKQLKYTFDYTENENVTKRKELKSKISKNRTDLETVNYKYALNNLDQEVFTSVSTKIKSNISILEDELSNITFDLSNSINYINESIKIVNEFSSLWRNQSIEIKKDIQNIVFSNHIEYDVKSKTYRTPYENEVLSMMVRVSDKGKTGNKGVKPLNSRLVLKVGIEPTHPKVLDFESSASTNSAT